MKWLKLIVLAALILYIILTAIVYTLQRQFLYYPPQLYLTPQAVGLVGFEEIVLQADNGDKLTALWSEGVPTQPDIERAAEIQRDFLIGQGIRPTQIVYFGTSLGSGVAAQLAEKHPPSLLILDAPFNSILDMGRRQLPFLPVKLLMKDQYRSDKALKSLDIPIIWMHGTADRVVPLFQGQKLYDSYEGPKAVHIIQNGQHTNLWGLGGREIVLKALSGD